MTVYCPKCGSARIYPQGDPFLLDVEVNQTLMGQNERCIVCAHLWTDKWWEVTDESGKITIHELEDKPS